MPTIIKPSPEVIDLVGPIHHRIAKRIDLPVERQILMAVALAEFVVDAIEKYAKGQEEHSDSDITECNLDREIRAETIDLFWYNTAKNW